MKNNLTIGFLFLALAQSMTVDVQAQRAGDDGGIASVPAGSAFTYQGVLKQGGTPFTGNAEMTFALWDDPAAGVLIANASPSSQVVSVSNGQFTIQVDFGPSAFVSPNARWVSVSVRTPPGSGSYSLLTPRQRITPAPVAMYALNGAGLTLPYAGNFSLADAVFQITNPNANGGGLYGEANLYGVQGRTSATGGVGVTAYHTASGNVGYLGGYSHAVYGISSGLNGGNGVYGVNNAAFNGVGVEGMHSQTGNRGDLGHPQYGVFASAGVTSSIAVGATHTPSGNAAYLGTAIYGVDAVARGNSSYGVHVKNTDTLSEAWLCKNFEGLFAQHGFYRNKGWIGGDAAAVYAYSDEPDAAHAIGILAESTKTYGIAVKGILPGDSDGFAGYFAGRGYFRGFVGFGTDTPAFAIDVPNLSTNFGRGRANAWTTYSSIRWKDNVQPIADALGKVLRLRGVTFDWKPEYGGEHDIGFVAEEVGAVVPELVCWEDDGQFAQSMKYDRVTALTVEAIKQQQENIAQLRAEKDAEIAALKSRLEQLEKTVAELTTSLIANR